MFYTCQRLFPMGRTGEGRHYLGDPSLASYWNSWRGYATEAAPGDWSLLKAHLLHTVCRGSADHYEYLMNWIAHRFQRPYIKPRVGIVTWGDKQIGKSLVADEIRKTIGEAHTAIINRKGELAGDFVDLSRVVFCQSEEALYAGDPSTASILKHNVTSDTVRVEVKHMMAQDRPSYTGFWFTGNDTNPVHVTADEERFFVLHVSPEKKGDKEYFNAILNQMRHGGRAAMLHELLNRDLSDFNILKLPVMPAFGELVLAQLPEKEQAIVEMIIEGAIILRDHDGSVLERIPLHPTVNTTVDDEKALAYLSKVIAGYSKKTGRKRMVTEFLQGLGIVAKRIETNASKGTRGSYVLFPLDDMRRILAKRWSVAPAALGMRTEADRQRTEADLLVDAQAAVDSLTAILGEDARGLEDLRREIGSRNAALRRSKFTDANAHEAAA